MAAAVAVHTDSWVSMGQEAQKQARIELFRGYTVTNEMKAQAHAKGIPEMGIGDGSYIENAIIDKNARVGKQVSIRNREGYSTFDDGLVVIREGIVVVPRGGIIPDGYSI